MTTEDVGDALARPLEAAHVAHLGALRFAHLPHEPRRGEHEEPAHREQRVEPPAPDERFGDERREGRRRESGHAIDAERHAAPRGLDEVEDVRKVRHEERGEAKPLEHTHGDEQRHVVGDRREQRGGEDARDADEHEGTAAQRVDPRPEQRLADDAHRTVDPHHEADLDLVAAELLDVERQEDEAVLTREEKEAGEHRPAEGGVR